MGREPKAPWHWSFWPSYHLCEWICEGNRCDRTGECKNQPTHGSQCVVRVCLFLNAGLCVFVLCIHIGFGFVQGLANAMENVLGNAHHMLRVCYFQETERTLENMKDSDLRCLLDEVCSYKHTGDMQGKSPLVQVLSCCKWFSHAIWTFFAIHIKMNMDASLH